MQAGLYKGKTNQSTHLHINHFSEKIKNKLLPDQVHLCFMCNSPKADVWQARHKTLAITSGPLRYKHFALLSRQPVGEMRLKLLNADSRFTKGFILGCLHLLLACSQTPICSFSADRPQFQTPLDKRCDDKPQGGQLARGSISDPAEPLRQPCQMVSKFCRLYLGAYKYGRRVH